MFLNKFKFTLLLASAGWAGRIFICKFAVYKQKTV